MAITKIRGLQQIQSGSIGGHELTESIASQGIILSTTQSNEADGHAASGSLQLDSTFTPTFAGISSSAPIDVLNSAELSESRIQGALRIEGSVPIQHTDGTTKDMGLIIENDLTASGIFGDFLEISSSPLSLLLA